MLMELLQDGDYLYGHSRYTVDSLRSGILYLLILFIRFTPTKNKLCWAAVVLDSPYSL